MENLRLLCRAHNLYLAKKAGINRMTSAQKRSPIPNPKYGTMPARLRMQVIAKHGSDPIDFELWCLAVSAINGCGVCVDSHENVLREKGVSEETVLAAVRIASTIHALAAILDADPVATV